MCVYMCGVNNLFVLEFLGATLIEFYSRKYESSAPLHGCWQRRIHNKQITIDGCVVTDPNTILREGAELVYHRLPWKEPDAPYLLEILYEDNDVVIIDQPIGLVRYPGVAKGLYVASPSGKPALSKVVVLERDMIRKSTLVQVEIQSGRPHQIRIHVSFIGHPLVGDPLYSTGGQPKCSNHEVVDRSFAEDGGYERPGKPVPGDCGYHLHAHHLVFPHPVTNEVVKITAPLPSILLTQEESKGKHIS
ncbi:UNVERIFIED_CONTAM: RNA pseudouridine synthase 5 [Sesamum angustifolium]|uniref:RNA pseudouridine synthase 5 n=1 Tax=Sesamum angustifolium TaxID=2727405 RepID=A0AAW2PTS2_9LAMI